MTIVIDNCLPVSWIAYLQGHGHVARHWRELGSPHAPDSEIMAWAYENSAVVLTQDLDFTRLLFRSRATLPSVIQLRLDDVWPVGRCFGVSVFDVRRSPTDRGRFGCAAERMEDRINRMDRMPKGRKK